MLDEGGKELPHSFLYWRHGKLIGVVGAAGPNPRRNDRATLHFAQIQQRRMEAPTPYTEAERDDTEVWLDDPGLKPSAYWADSSFVPGRGLGDRPYRRRGDRGEPRDLPPLLQPWRRHLQLGARDEGDHPRPRGAAEGRLLTR